MKKLFAMALALSLVVSSSCFEGDSESSPKPTILETVFFEAVVVPCIGAGDLVQAVTVENSVIGYFPSVPYQMVNGAMVLSVLCAGALIVHDITHASAECSLGMAAALFLYGIGKSGLLKKA